MTRLLKVGITHGDYNGIGYEVTLKALADDRIPELFTPVFFAIPELVAEAASRFELELPKINIIADASEAQPGILNVVDIKVGNVKLQPGIGTPESGAAAVKALEMGVASALEGTVDCLVTAPISKEAVQSNSFNFTGHTEFLAERAEAKTQMILFDDSLRVALLSTHKAISEIPATVTLEGIVEALHLFNNSLSLDFGYEKPNIAVLSLNPHCGDGGLLGREEIEVIKPALESLEPSMYVFGPYAADGFFASGNWKKFDGVLAMYHDQGLAPFKALAGQRGVNFTSGLPFVRTSPDHGTGFDIAWAGVADPTSMREALYKAIDLTRTRRRNLAAAANPLKVQPPEKQDKKEHKNEKPAVQ